MGDSKLQLAQMASNATAGDDAAQSPSSGGVQLRKICVLGAGAIGGLLGVHLSLRGHTVTFLARGAHHQAMKSAGYLELLTPDGDEIRSAPNCVFTDDLSIVPPQDTLILALKMHQIHAVLDYLPNLYMPHTEILTTQNGIPWWYFQRMPSSTTNNTHFPERTLKSIDPDGKLRHGIPAERLLASVVYPAAKISSPGQITHEYGIRFPLGELDGSISKRAISLAEMLIDAGFKSPVLPDVRAELWLKLWGTVAVNPISALTHATLAEMCDENAPSRPVVEAVMKEVQQIARALGSEMRVPMERRVEGARKVGHHRTSMLEDARAGRPMEIDAIMGAVMELAEVAQIRTPALDAVYGCAKMLAYVMRSRNAKSVLRRMDTDEEC